MGLLEGISVRASETPTAASGASDARSGSTVAFLSSMRLRICLMSSVLEAFHSPRDEI